MAVGADQYRAAGRLFASGVTVVTVARGAHRTSAGTVRDHLLHACWRIWWEIGCPSGVC